MAKTIIFDMGGVLVNLDWDSVCTRLQEHSGLADVRPDVVNGPIVQSAMLGHLTSHPYHEALCEKLAASISYEEFIEIWNGLLSANESIVPVVERLKRDNHLVLASNTDPIHFQSAVERFPVLKNFGQRFLSYEMGLLKPDPDFYRHVLRMIGSPATDCIFIDDRPENVKSALSVGMSSFNFVGVSQLESDLSNVLLT